jgi:hypothetical protein
MEMLSSIFSKSEKAYIRCRAMCGSRKGLEARISANSYKHYNLRGLSNNSRQSCSMCFKILRVLQDNKIEDEPGNQGWINFFALGGDRKRMQVRGPVNNDKVLPPEANRMRYLKAEDPKKNDHLIFMCSAEGTLSPREALDLAFHQHAQVR